MEEKLSVSKIKSKLNTEFFGRKIHHFSVTDSTNSLAKENPQEPDGTVFIAEKQLKGRGRLSREWLSEQSEGIYMSVLLKPSIPPEQIPKITLVAGLSATVALNKISSENVLIKWPNDCVINGKKICGILTELSCLPSENTVTVGIGINVNNTLFPKDLKSKATSLLLETGRTYSREDIVSLILSEFEKRYIIFLNQGFSALAAEYSRLCVTLDREVEIISPSERYTAYASGIDSEGRLLINLSDGVKAIDSGEVSVRGILGYV